jgi:transposase-like protein
MLSSRDLVQMMAERGILLAHTTILRWVQRYVPDFEKRWQAYARPVGSSWRVDETYIKVKGQWVYLYRAVDKAGRTVDFLLSRRRDMASAKRFFSRATKQQGAPRVITLDGYAASHQAVAKLKISGILPRRIQVRSCKYLNNVIEQDHRRIKQRVRPMLGFKRFETAAVTIRGIELAEKIKKHQFNLRPLTGKAITAPEMWTVVLAGLKSAKSFARQKHTLKKICTRTLLTSLREGSFEQSGVLSGNSSLDCEALSELSHLTGECREVSALAARGDAEGHRRRNFVPKLDSIGYYHATSNRVWNGIIVRQGTGAVGAP